MRGRDIISVAVERIASEDIAADVGMAMIRQLTGVTNAKLRRVWEPDVKRPGFWRVEATYLAVRPPFPYCSCQSAAVCAIHGEDPA